MNKFRNSCGSLRTENMFYERKNHKMPDDIVFLFTLEKDIEGLLNFGKLFVSLMDVTGYDMSQKYLDSFEHFRRLEECNWFKEYLEKWRSEIKEILRSEALKKIREIATGSTQHAVSAAKFLANAEWETKGRGRPSKEELTGELKKMARAATMEDEDMDRIIQSSNKKVVKLVKGKA